MAMGRNPAVDLKIMPVKVAAPTELYSSSSPPRNFPMSVSRLQYISAVDQNNRLVFMQKNKPNFKFWILVRPYLKLPDYFQMKGLFLYNHLTH